MNYLAHLILSHHDPEILLGNFIGDSIKGNLTNEFSESVKTGIELHRFIDQFSDDHPIFNQGRRRFFDEYRHFSRVIIDVIYDHLLSIHWLKYANITLPEFVDISYKILEKSKLKMPPNAQRFYFYSKRYSLLKRYHDLSVIGDVIAGIGNRIKMDIDSTQAILIFNNHQAQFTNEFNSFFPLILNETKLFIEKKT